MLNKKASEIVFRLRGLVGGIFTVIVLVFPGHFSFVRLICGTITLLAGQTIRFWAAGYIPAYRTETIGAPALITSGPYAYVRNPLYVGNFLIGAGWTVMAGWLWLIIFVIIYVIVYKLMIIPAEENFLENKFGAVYASYKKKVPAFFPNLVEMKKMSVKSNQAFALKTAYKEEIYSIRINILITVLFFVRMYSVR
jgi:protein-S-isoprenylcysteine O-methyltransferase Ste14